MPSTVLLFTAVAGITTIGALAVFFLGIPPELKQKLERGVLKVMGENKLSYLTKDHISKVPETNQQELKELKQRVGGSIAEVLKNSIGRKADDTPDHAKKPSLGR